jgi:hypothetical protein
MPATPVVDPRVTPSLADTLMRLAAHHVGGEPVVLRVGITDHRGDTSYSITAVAASAHLVAIAESRQRAGEWQTPVVQTVPRRRVAEVAANGDECWAIVDVAALDASTTGFQIEGPAMSLPPGTLAHEILPAD